MPSDAVALSEDQKVVATLRDMIEEWRLPDDGRLPTERELAAELGTGRRCVRRALDSLEAEGLIWRKQGKGTFAGQPPDPTGVLAAEIASEVDPMVAMEARLCIEPALAELCALRATGEDVVRLRSTLRAGGASDRCQRCGALGRGPAPSDRPHRRQSNHADNLFAA